MQFNDIEQYIIDSAKIIAVYKGRDTFVREWKKEIIPSKFLRKKVVKIPVMATCWFLNVYIQGVKHMQSLDYKEDIDTMEGDYQRIRQAIEMREMD